MQTSEDYLKNAADLKNEDNLKNEDDHKKRRQLKNEDNFNVVILFPRLNKSYLSYFL